MMDGRSVAYTIIHHPSSTIHSATTPEDEEKTSQSRQSSTTIRSMNEETKDAVAGDPEAARAEQHQRRGRAELPPPSRGRKRWLGLAGAMVLVLILAGLAYYYFNFMAPYESTDDAFIEGNVTMVSARVSGQVEQLFVTDNQEVKKGQALLKLDPSLYQAKVDQEQASLAAAQGALDQAKAQTKVDEAKAEQAQATVTAAQAEANRAKADLKRYQSVESRAVSKTQLDLAQSQARAATARLQAAQQQAKAAQAQVTLSHSTIEAAQAGVAQAQAKLEQAQLDLSHTEVIAPRDGRVTARSVRMGVYVQPGQALLALVPPHVWVVGNFKETQLSKMRPGQPVQIHIDAYPQLNLKGKIDSFQHGTGARFSLLPPENAVGNFVKVVQRVPVKIVFTEPLPSNLDISPGMSVEPKVRVQ